MFSHSGHVMTLANSIIGVGILAMPFCFQKCGIILSILLLIISNWVTRICCHYLIKSSLLTRRKSFEFLGFHAFGTSGKLLVELCIIGYLLGTCITYFVVVGDLGPQIVTKMFSLDSPHVHLRTWIMIAVTLVCILPLGMLKNVDSLSTVCTASIGFYICLVIKIVLESEEHIVANDWNEHVVYWRPAGVLQCLPIFSMALSCQMQLFEVFESINNQSLEKLNEIVKNATWICTFVYIAVGFFGYVAFCTQTFSGNILMNLSPALGSDVIKIGFVLSVAFSFPLVIFPCRASIYSLLYRKGHTDATGYIPESRFKAITIFIVGLALCIALMIPSVELIIGLVGSTIGVAICIMFPASCFRKIVKKDSTERMLAQFILVSGFCLMILGTYANLSAIDEKRSGSHLEVPNVDPIVINPTQLPEDKLKELPKNLEPKLNLSKELPKLPESVLKTDAVIDAKQPETKIPQEPKIIPKLESSPPPLPVDDAHDIIKTDKEEKPVEKSLNISPKPDVVEVIPLEVNKTLDLANDAAPGQKNNSIIVTTQGINKDAIKKDEEVAAEELKNDKTAKANNEELQKTQNELKKTKEFLERKVDELKEELAKQNKETQNLVVEKLGEVVEKVEQIEREVHQKEPKTRNLTEVEKPVIENKVNKNEEEAEPIRKKKGPLMSILTESANRPIAEEPQPKARVYEPLSYKTGELVENAKNATNLEQRLRMPLPLLINASQPKGSENQADANEAAPKPKDNLKPTIEKEPVKDLDKKPMKEETKVPLAVKTDAENTANKDKTDFNKKNETEKQNLEAIRRDILQLKPEPDQEVTETQPEKQHDRVKRSNEAIDHINFDEINSKLEQKNCLTDVKVETLMAHGASAAIEFKMQSIGRDLKAVSDETENK